MDLSTHAKSINEPRNLGDGLVEYIEERRNNPIEMSGISTGFSILDKQIDGLVPGTLTIISARKKMGKSTFLSNVAAHIAYRLHIPALYIDTEMSFDEWRDRIIAMLSGIEERVVKHGGYTKEHYDEIKKAVEIIGKGKLFHQRMPNYSVDKLTSLYKKYKIKEKIGVGIFDYLKEPDSANSDKRRQEWQILGDVTTRIKDLAGDLSIPFITAVQLNRNNEVAGSDRISWFGDIVMQWMHKEQKEMDAKGFEGGQFKLVIRDTRRGGGTPEEGIGYKFYKKKLLIKEALPIHQVIQYGDNVIDHASDDEDELI
jgi:replicative DNA helicase